MDLAYGTDASNIIITGDFNYNYLNTAGHRKATSLFEPYGLVQLIDEPTHYTESSESIIDLLLTRNASSLLLCGVGDAFLDQNIRYHCPIYAIFNFDKHKRICYKRNIWQYENGNYDLLKQYVNEFDWLSLKSDDVNTYAVQSTLKSLVTGKACGPDQINNRILKELSIELAPVLTDLFNTSLLHCTVPDIWKKS